ncbi:ricin-type beta-trefoil lectin domain protein [Kitasatospora sp. NPDC088391]|uniref:ricin-type beta-trefoil lectin domain protein n=1 Tax=Kitasatospora sp. NPDC088391 TaxID=3364074 RepID=UPI00382A8934
MPVTTPAHPVPPTWQPPKSAPTLPHGKADVRLGAAPANRRKGADQQPAAGEEAAASGLPVGLAPLEDSALAGQSVQVDLVDPAAATAAGLPGPVLKLTGPGAGGGLRVGLDAAALGKVYGSDRVSRMRLVSLPACALTTPQVPGCLAQTPLDSRLDAATGRLTADVVLPGGDGTARTQLQGVGAAQAQQSAVVAAVSGASSGAGSYAATPLNSSQAWSAGSSSGAFDYSYPIQGPPSLAGAAPSVALGYDSASVDGKTSSTNAQASWVGDGWDYNAGFVERSYQSCTKHGIANSGDECWAGANLVMSLAGHSGELVRDDASCQGGAAATMEQSACTWRLRNDDGSRVQFLTGATNGTWNGSYIKVTDTSGTVYYFGLNHLPDASGNPSTKGPDSGSAWTVPVYSPNAGDPCYDSAKGKASWCQTGWRWNLDYVVDAHGNLVTYTYTPETNNYSRGGAQNNGSGTLTPYNRSGVLHVIGYGQLLSDQIAANGAYKPAAQIVFDSGERCVTSPTACDPANRTSAHAGDWPDVPIDQQCASTGACTVYGPTFWSTKWLNSITTQVRYNGAYQDVDSYALSHRFVNVQNATENTQVPWLASVQRTGKDTQASSTPVTLPPVSFTEMLLPNRVDGTNLVPSRPAYNRPRIQLITTETGSTVGVDYYPADCSRVNNSMPGSADTDTRSCYNVKWHVPNEVQGADPVDDWFQRYPVKSVTVTPGTPNAAPMTTAYSYGNAAWHRNDSELTDAKDRTWDNFRGYASVTTVSGNGNDGPKGQTSATYHQGMNGDRKADGSTRAVSVTGPMGGSATDDDWLSGMPFEQDTHTQAGGPIVSWSGNTGGGSTVTATHHRTGLPDLTARYGGTVNTSTAKSLKADGSWATGTKTTTTDAAHDNRVLTVLDSADGSPDVCRRTVYATSPNPAVTGLVSELLTVTGPNACTATPTAQNTSSWSRVKYDGQPQGQAGAKAEATTKESLDRFDGTTPVFSVDSVLTYDVYGRGTSTTAPLLVDAAHPNGSTVTTAYTAQQPGELAGTITVTSPAPAGAPDQATGRTSVTTLDTARSLTRTSTDANGRVTTVGYDALGRTVAAWMPGRSTSLTPNVAHAYSVPGIVNGKVVPPTTTTTNLIGTGPTGTYSTSKLVQIMDGTGRTVQTQTTPALSAYSGRIVTEAVFDSQGRSIRTNGPWYNGASGPGTILYEANTTQEVPNQTHTVYDGMGRPVTGESVAYGVVQNTTTTAHPGVDRTDTTPPAGGTPTTTVTDARGRTVQLWQYRTPTATGNPADADVTTYAFDQLGHPSTRKDAAGNTWSYGYDVRGRQTSVTDPDTGTSTTAYDAAGRVASTTDARGRSVLNAYDLLGRPTATFDGLSADPAKQLTAHTYDTLLKGQPTSSTRYVGGTSGKTYASTVGSYDTAYHPTKVTTTIPGAEVGAATPFSYTYQAVYDQVTGLLLRDNRPAIGGLSSERIDYSYDAYGLLIGFGAFGGSTYDLSNDYDAYGRPIRTTVNPWGTQIVVTNTYDESTGRQLSQFVDKQTAATGAVQQTTYAYDAVGRITGIRSIPDNTPSATDLQCFSYDYLNRLTTAWTDKGALNLAPNPAVGGRGSCANSSPTSGAVAPAKNTVGGSAPYWQDYTYDLTGNRKSLTQHDPSGDTAKDTVTTQVFPAAGTVNNGNGQGGPHALTSATAVTGASSVQTATGYDAVGNTTSQSTYSSGTTTFEWNTEGRLDRDAPAVQIQGIGGNCLYLQGSSGNDGTPAEISACSPSGAQKFSTTGNLLKALDKCLTATGSTPGSAVKLQSCDGSSAQKWTAQPNGTITNGASGLCLAVPGDVTTSGTDTVVATCGTTTIPAGQKWTVPDNATGYVYDGEGAQLVRHNPGKTSVFLGPDELTYDTVTKATTATRTYRMPGGLSLVRQGSTNTWQVSDQHGTAGLSFDGTTLAETRRPTDPFGNPRGVQPATWAGSHGFVDGTKDEATGLTNLGARQYDPRTGRFVNPDPLLNLIDPQQWNGYAYSGNDPVNSSDPSGLMNDTMEKPCDSACVEQNNATIKKANDETAEYFAPKNYLKRSALGHKLPDATYKIITGPSYRYQGSQDFTIGEALKWAATDSTGWYTVCMLMGHSPDECNTDPFNGETDIGKVDVGPVIGVTLMVAGAAVMAIPCQEGWLACFEAVAGAELAFVSGGSAIVATASAAELQGIRMLVGDSFEVNAAKAAEEEGAAAAAKALGLPSCPTGHSFAPDTPVVMADGTTRPIKDVQVGDRVLTGDPDSGARSTSETVTATHVNHDKDLVDVTVADTAGAPSTVRTTAGHPFWDGTDKQWIPAGQLVPGHVLATDDNRQSRIVAVVPRAGTADMDNLTVARTHTFYVRVGGTTVLVHNALPCPPRMALGLSSYDEPGGWVGNNNGTLMGFAESNNAQFFEHWGSDWEAVIRAAMKPDSTTEIYFNLEGIDNPRAWAATVTDVSKSPGSDVTAWELALIRDAPASVQARVRWLGGDGKNPFE